MRKLSVLIIDDNEIDRYVFVRELKKSCFDFSYIEKVSGKDALDYFNSLDDTKFNGEQLHVPEIAFLDVNMPIMGGHEFLSNYQKLEITPSLKITKFIMSTSSQSKEDVVAAEKFDNVVGYIVKGRYTIEELNDKIAQALGIDTQNVPLEKIP